MSESKQCHTCTKDDPRTVYNTSALSECCGKLHCDACLIQHYAEQHPEKRVQDNPDIAGRIRDWLS